MIDELVVVCKNENCPKKMESMSFLEFKDHKDQCLKKIVECP
jgi:hypothetical protein